MLDRLIESWLDSASERSYQSVFCQMLAADGHVVVHSTRHMPIEFGKDVITVAPDHIPCAFQLKGNPGGRLTLTDFREVAPQLIELVTHPIVLPGITRKQHRCYLVTNGEIDEEVHRSVSDLNLGFENQGYGPNRIELWPRGQLLEMATRLGSSLWPSELEDMNTLLELLVHRGDDLLPIDKLHRLLRRLLRLEDSDAQKIRAREVKRSVTSAAVLTAVALRNFSGKENHFAVLSAWVLFISYAIAACERHQVSFDRAARKSVQIAKTAILVALASMCDEIISNKGLAPDRGPEIAPMLRARGTLLYGLMSLYWLWASEDEWPNENHADFLRSWIPRNYQHSLWGEGAIPQMLAHYWFLSRTDAGWNSEYLLASLLSAVVSLNTNYSQQIFPSPYFSFEDTMRHQLWPFLGSGPDPLQDETASGSSYLTEGLLHLVVRSNMKQTIKSIWPSITQLGLMRYEPDNEWQYCLYRNEGGQGIMGQAPPTKAWSDLVEEARDCRVVRVPAPLLAEKFILALFVLILPYRATPEVLRYLGWKLGTVWFVPPPIE
jgi:hypothetical protein